MTNKDIIDIIYGMVGTPYRTDDSDKGYNCYEFMIHVFSLAGLSFTSNIYNVQTDLKLIDPPAKFLDVAHFKDFATNEHHVGVMLDHRLMAHCAQASNGVAIADVSSIYWKRIFKGLYRHKALCE